MKKSESSNKNAWPLVGNEHIFKYLQKSLENGRVAGAYIFLGPDDLGKTTAAKFFAQTLLCRSKESGLPCGACDSCRRMNGFGDHGLEAVHLDYHLVKKEEDKKNISIEQIREFIRSLSLSSFMNSYKIGVIKNAETLSVEAANSLLKTLEEPKNKVVIILVASNLDGIPSTIVSRSQVMTFRPVKSELIYDDLVNDRGANRSIAKDISRLCLGRPALAVKLFEDNDFYRSYMSKAELLLDMFDMPINERFDKIGAIIGKEAAGQEVFNDALMMLGIWKGVLRDMVLGLFGQNDLVQHEAMISKLEKAKNNIGLDVVLGLAKKLENCEEMMRANVNPRFVLENFACELL